MQIAFCNLYNLIVIEAGGKNNFINEEIYQRLNKPQKPLDTYMATDCLYFYVTSSMTSRSIELYFGGLSEFSFFNFRLLNNYLYELGVSTFYALNIIENCVK